MALDMIGSRVTGVHRTSVNDAKLSDHALIEATKQGDENAFSEIIGRYKNPITNYLFRYLNDYEEAVDLAQETFVRVYFAIERYHTDYAFSTYIYRIATNLAISELRKRKRRRLMSLTRLFQSDENEDVEFQPTDDQPLPERVLLDSERDAAVAKAIVAPAAMVSTAYSLHIWLARLIAAMSLMPQYEPNVPRVSYSAPPYFGSTL